MCEYAAGVGCKPVAVSVPAHMVSVLHCMGPSNLNGNEKLQIEAGLQQ